ncbi:hypothetical protein EUTSA_v10021981mg [Eutrema salsugineum]|uniref:F-box associated beta-propeller type 1 domain-containing protein n=1 Tax=Eutrema salsugineum TaxID=72664 RepID=V4LBE3_EUTSA|nr:hypothetical protein EUTSA_v10021981mg [Eutrema salsugineum]
MTNRNLSEDLVVEILSRVPVGSLVLMLIEFRVYLLNVDFRGIHDNNVVQSAKITSQFSLKDPIFDSSEEEVYIREVFHCDGLLLCTTKDSNRLVVWNPCSGETRWIQPKNSYKESDRYGLGKSLCNKYKILRQDNLSISSQNRRYEYEIYNFTSDSWNDIDVNTDGYIPGS